jgi:PAS domain S-box-containing protein
MKDPSMPAGAPQRVLFVHDFAAERTARSAMLRDAGFAVLEAGTGAEALQHARHGRLDVVFLSALLPDMETAELCRRLRLEAGAADTPIVQLAGEDADPSSAAGLLATDPNMFVAESLDAGTLVETTKAVLRMRAATDRLRRLQRLSASLANAGSTGEVVRVVETEMIAALGAAGGVVVLLDSQAQVFRRLMSAGYSQEVCERFETVPAGAPLPIPDAVRAERPLFFETRRERDEKYPHLASVSAVGGDGALVAAPMLVNGRVLGGIAFCFAADRRFTSDERAFIVTASRLCAAALERVRLSEAEREAHRDARDSADQLARLEAVTAALSGACGAGDVLDAIAHRVMAAAGADAAMVCVLEPQTGGLRCMRTAEDPEFTKHLHALPEDSLRLLTEAVEAGRTIVRPTPAGDADAVFACIPMRVDERTTGAIGLRFPAGKSFTNAEIALLEGMSRRCAEALERAHKSGAEAEGRLALAQDAAQLGIWEYDAALGAIRCSPEHFRLFGLDPGRNRQTYQEWLECIHPGDRERVARAMQAALETPGPYDVSYRVVRPDGSIRSIRSWGRSIAGAEGKPATLIGAAAGVTPLAIAGDELQGWRERHQALHQACGQIVYEWDPRTGRIRWEGLLESLVGYTGEEIAVVEEWRRLIHPNDLPVLDDALARVLRDRTQFLLDYRVRRKNGSYGWLRDTGHFFYGGDGAALRMAGFVQDITTERRAQIRLSIAQKAARAGVWDWDLATGEIFWSPELYDLCGIDRSVEPSRAFWLAHILPEDRERAAARLELALEQRRAEVELEYRWARRDQIRWFSSIGNAYYDPAGKPLRITGIVIDITEHKLADEALREAGRLESIGQLAGGVAHQFNNLLTGVLGNASLLLHDARLAAQDREMLQGIINSSQQAANLVKQLLAYSGQGRFQLERLDLPRVLEGWRDLLATSTPKHVRVEMYPGGKLPAVETDATQLRQIVLNLVLNAGEAVPDDREGLVIVSCGMEILDAVTCGLDFPGQKVSPGRYVYIEVRDNGTGIAPGAMQRIFEPFFSTKFVGRGLGLAAVAGIVRSHRGGIRVRTEPGAGAEFRVYLPAVPAPKPRIRKLPRVVPATPAVLIADDEEVVRQLASAVLERLGFEALAASNGREALEAIEARGGRVDVVVLDIAMPAMGGIEAFHQMRRRWPDLRVLISSGYDEAEALRQLRGEEIAGFLQKPYTATELSDAIRRALESR